MAGRLVKRSFAKHWYSELIRECVYPITNIACTRYFCFKKYSTIFFMRSQQFSMTFCQMNGRLNKITIKYLNYTNKIEHEYLLIVMCKKHPCNLSDLHRIRPWRDCFYCWTAHVLRLKTKEKLKKFIDVCNLFVNFM